MINQSFLLSPGFAAAASSSLINQSVSLGISGGYKCTLSLETPCTFFRWRPRFPLCVKVLWQKGHLKGLIPVCFLKWSLRLQLFLNTLPQLGYRHLKYNLTLCVSGFLTRMVWCHYFGIPSNVLCLERPVSPISSSLRIRRSSSSSLSKLCSMSA